MLIENFLEMEITSKGVAKNTYIAYKKDLEFLELFLDKNFNKSIQQANKQDIERFFLHLSRDKKLSARSISRYITSVNSFYNFCISCNIIIENPCKSIVYPKLDKPLPIYLTPDEIKCLLDFSYKSGKKSFKQFRLYVMLSMLYSSGLRVSELLDLDKTIVTRINNQNNTNLISVVGKGNKERKIPIDYSTKVALLEYIERIKKENKKKLSINKRLFPITRMTFFDSLKKLAMNAGILPSKVSPHVFRHSIASHLLSSGADLRVIQQVLGHSDISTTAIYTHIQDEKLKNSVKLSHPFSKINKI